MVLLYYLRIVGYVMGMTKITREQAQEIIDLQLDYKASVYDDHSTSPSHYGRVELDILLDNIYGVEEEDD